MRLSNVVRPSYQWLVLANLLVTGKEQGSPVQGDKALAKLTQALWGDTPSLISGLGETSSHVDQFSRSSYRWPVKLERARISDLFPRQREHQ